MNTKQEIEKFIYGHKASILRDGGFQSLPADIDLHISKQDFSVLKQRLHQERVAVKKVHDCKYVVYKRFGSQWFMFDFLVGSLGEKNYITAFYKERFFVEKMCNRFLANPRDSTLMIRYNVMRYFLMKRGRSRYISYVIHNRHFLNRFLEEHRAPGSSSSQVLIRNFMQGSILAHARLLGWGSAVSYFYTKMLFRARRWNQGRLIAVVGPDGSGKSSLIDQWKLVGYRTVYLGEKNFYLQRVYNYLHRLGRAGSLVALVGEYFEQWLRYVWYIKVPILCNKSVITDRYPGYNNPLLHGKIKRFLYNTLYSLYPRPDVLLFIYVDPTELLRRKSELSGDEVVRFQERITQKVQGKKYVQQIENDDFERALQEGLFCMMHGCK